VVVVVVVVLAVLIMSFVLLSDSVRFSISNITSLTNRAFLI